jgi:hypothetical protein
LLGVGHLIVPVSARGQTVAFGPGLVVPGALGSSWRNDASTAGGAYCESEPKADARYGLADCGEHAVRVRGNRITGAYVRWPDRQPDRGLSTGCPCPGGTSDFPSTGFG